MHARSVHGLLERSAAEGPERTFIVHEDERASYGEIEARANRLARLLRERGVEPGDRVLVLATNSSFAVVAGYGAMKAGAVSVPLNAQAPVEAVERARADCGARLLLADLRSARIAAQVTGVEAIISPDLDGQDAEPLGLAVAADDLAAIIYTSGSTGAPRGVMLSHANILANTRSIVGYLGIADADRVLALLPFSYVYGLSVLNTHCAVGATVVIENRFAFPNTALDTLERERCTTLPGVPSTFAILLNRSTFAERGLKSLRTITQAGGPMAPELTRRLRAACPHARLYLMYGATEASARLAYLHPDSLDERMGSIGKAIPGVELRVLRPDDSVADDDEVGELVARGENIMRGYWGAAEETAAVLGPEGYRTGDLARRDADGFLWITGRARDMIKAGAHRIAAREIEDAVMTFEGVHETAVIGVPDDLLGEAIRVYVVFRGEPDTAELERHLKRVLPAYKVPTQLEVLAELPKNLSGKIDKPALRASAAV